MDGFAVAERLAAEPAAPGSSSSRVAVEARSAGRLATTPARGFITKAEFSGESLTLCWRGPVAGGRRPGRGSGSAVGRRRGLDPRRDSRTGPLLLLAGITWLAGDVWGALVYAHRGPLVHALLTYPPGVPARIDDGHVIVSAYVDGLVPGVARGAWVTVALTAAVVG